MAITDELCRSFLDLWWHFDPAAATRAGVGGAELDGQLGAFDPDSLRQHASAFRSIAGAVEELEVEDTADEIDRTALLDHLRVLLFRFEHEHPYRNPALWVEHLEQALEGLLAREGGDAPDFAAAALSRLRGIPGFLSSAGTSLRKPPQFQVETALALLDAMPALVDAVSLRFGAEGAEGANGADEADEARRALEQFGVMLGGLAVDPDPHAAAIGEDEVDRRLHHEHASIHNAAEVWRGTLRLATEVESEVSALAATLDPGRPWREVYERSREASPVWGELSAQLSEALELSARLLDSHGISAETPPLALGELSAAALVLDPVARYRPAGGAPAALLLGDPDRGALPWLAARLGTPGLHLHRSRRAALPGLVRRHVAATSTPLGWCLYAQELLPELGYLNDPEARLVERVMFLRDVHVALVDLGLHTKQLSPAEAVGHLTTHTPGEAAAALADVRRVALRPTSGCAAIMGRQELRRLRQDFRTARGEERGGLEDFQLEVFEYGGLPVPLIRWGMGLDA